jgi:uncharacterized delta-60 repeat protein
VRLNANGSNDTTFNGTGLLALPAKVGQVDIGGGTSVVIQPDGKIVVGVWAFKPSRFSSDAYFGVTRLNANGTIDTSFGSGGWWLANRDSGASSAERVSGLALLPDGSIMVGGQAKASNGKNGFAVAKLTSAGALATSYGAGGYSVVNVGASGNSASSSFAMTVTPAGGVILAGVALVAGQPRSQGCLVAFTTSGLLDTGFNGSGTVVGAGPWGAGKGAVFNSVITQGNAVVVGGYAWDVNVGSQAFVSRYTLAGTLDATFATNGTFMMADYPSRITRFTGLGLTADGSIQVGGISQYRDTNGVIQRGVLVGRLSAEGVPDTTYGTDGTGFESHHLGIVSLELAFAVGPDGKPVLSGNNTLNGTTQVTFFRFTAA